MKRRRRTCAYHWRLWPTPRAATSLRASSPSAAAARAANPPRSHGGTPHGGPLLAGAGPPHGAEAVRPKLRQWGPPPPPPRPLARPFGERSHPYEGSPLGSSAKNRGGWPGARSRGPARTAAPAASSACNSRTRHSRTCGSRRRLSSLGGATCKRCTTSRPAGSKRSSGHGHRGSAEGAASRRHGGRASARAVGLPQAQLRRQAAAPRRQRGAPPPALPEDSAA
mmetsp:Transcript_90177/g.269011  ORF Transcript_90177/g.269011 Transcript_90177/m.269011 type:complete len:224 (-) Transcript_90177:1000-1671(-)